jgi:hypothetical protein
MREIATIVEQHQETLDQAVAAIRAGFDRAKDHDRKAHFARIDVGLKLIALRKRIEAGKPATQYHGGSGTAGTSPAAARTPRR